MVVLVAAGAGFFAAVSTHDLVWPGLYCVPPPGADDLMSAYLADPVIDPATYGPTATAPPVFSAGVVGVRGPMAKRYCDGDLQNNVGMEGPMWVVTTIDVPDQYLVYPGPQLRPTLDAALTRSGWRYGGDLHYRLYRLGVGAVYCKPIHDVMTSAEFAGPPVPNSPQPQELPYRLSITLRRAKDSGYCA
jgi:hypothetical protein